MKAVAHGALALLSVGIAANVAALALVAFILVAGVWATVRFTEWLLSKL